MDRPARVLAAVPGMNRPRRSSGLDPVVCNAYAARRSALALLPLRVDGDDARRHVEQAPLESTEAWELFLRRERCGNALDVAIRSSRCEDLLSDSVRLTLGREAAWERERIASARRQLATLAAWAADSGARPIVLKGGVPALGPNGLDQNDVDILLPIEDAENLQTWLLAREGSGPGYASPTHLRQVRQHGELAVEIHYALDDALGPESGFWHRIQEIPGAPGLYRLAPADHLWHVLAHQIVEHVPRRGRIRDLLLLEDALASCAPEDVDVARSRARRHRLSDVLERALDYALRWSRGLGGDDPFVEIALAAYLVSRRKENRSRVYPTSGETNRWTFALLAGPTERRAVWASIWARSEDLSGLPVIRHVQKLSPPLGRLLQRSVRFVFFTGVYIRALPLAASIRRRVRRYRRAVTGESATT